VTTTTGPAGAAAATAPLRAGHFVVDPPVVLAPMAGITNRAFRRLCRESGAGLYVSEMITSRALLERSPMTLEMVEFDPDESPRSIQLYGVDPQIVGDAVRLVVDEDRADHVDLNFGCPVPKVTRKGGGSALPWKADLFRAIVREAVRAADGRVPVTVKMRVGIDDEHVTYLDAGLAASQEGAAWVALHGRTAAQLYGGRADRGAIARLVDLLHPLGTPVLGNGDIWTAQDALDMVAETGCAGVVVGRGCLGRPWLFGQLAAAFAGAPVPGEPDFAGVAATMRRHAALLADVYGADKGVRDFRKHVAWYTKGFAVGGDTRRALAMVSTLDELDALLATIDPRQPYPGAVAAGPRGRTSGGRRPTLPEGWLDSREIGAGADLSAAEIGVSGG
jgi:nifR3 family TIM-barrel protein